MRATPHGEQIYVLSCGVREADGRPLNAGQIARLLADGDDLVRVATPFAAASVDSAGRVTVAADHAGLRHVYAARGAGWAAVSTSALELARLTGQGLDVDALGEYRLIGHYLGAGTAFRDVGKLAPGHLWRMADGVLTEEACPGIDAAPRCAQDEAPRRHADRLRHLVSCFLDEYPDTTIELSGGMDSRMVLAAIPPARRAGLRALTLTYPDSTDGPIAADLARRYRLVHQMVDVAGVTELSPQAAYERVQAAALRMDALGAPLSLAVFDWAESQVAESPRLGGHGGELARGFYHMQRQHPHVDESLVDRLTKWWIISNNAVADAALTPEFAAESRHRVHLRLREIFAGYRTDWLTATDQFYLRHRLQRWAGLTLTDAAQSRIVANPLLDPEVLALTRAVPRERLCGSRYAAQVLDRLDPELARLPLCSGVRPVALSRRVTFTRQLGGNTVRGFTRKAVDKAGRRLRSKGRPAVGAAAMAELVSAHWRADPQLLGPALTSGLVREDWLAQFLDGTVDANPATVDFLVNLAVIGMPCGGGP